MLSIEDHLVLTSQTSGVFQPATRVQTSILTGWERKCLTWLASRIPQWVTSDQLTVLGLISMIAGGAFYILASDWTPALMLVNVCLALNWFGDSLDGTLARARNRQRPRYGYYVDHVVDVLGILALICGLASSGFISWVVALAFLVAYYLLSIEVYLATNVLGTFRMSFCKLGPTEMRILLAAGNIKAMVGPHVRVLGRDYLFFDAAVVAAIAVLSILVIVSFSRNLLTLYRAEPL